MVSRRKVLTHPGPRHKSCIGPRLKILSDNSSTRYSEVVLGFTLSPMTEEDWEEATVPCRQERVSLVPMSKPL